MPIFEFSCAQCGHLFETILSNSDDTVELTCPKCGSETLDRVVSRTNYVMGAGKGGKEPKITAKSCGEGNQCLTVDIPGPTR